MKKLTAIALATAAIMIFAIPAMAVDVDLSGDYVVRGYFMDNTDLSDNSGASDAYMSMRFRLNTVFKVNDVLSLTTRLDAPHDRELGTRDDLTSNERDNIDIDRVYLTAKLDMCELHIGRMGAGTFGTAFNDIGYFEADQIKLVHHMDPLTATLTYQKRSEGDGMNRNAGGLLDADADLDEDRYYASLTYKAEGVESGLLLGYYNDKSMSDTSPTTVSGVSVPSPLKSKYWLVNPYIVTDVGPVKVEGELVWYTGDAADFYVDGAADDIDYDAMAWHLKASMDAGPTDVSLGWAHVDGQESSSTERTYIKTSDLEGADFQPLLILTGYYMDANLGGIGNLNARNMRNTTTPIGGMATQYLGFDIYYGTIGFAPMENMSIYGTVAVAQADETDYAKTLLGVTSMDDDIGWEYDVGLTLKLMDNLTYKAVLGYLRPGDMWKLGTTADVDNTWSALQTLKVTF